MSQRVGRHQVLTELVRMRREIERLINELTGDNEREFVKNLNAGQDMSIKGPQPGANLLSTDEIEARWGVVEDHSGEISPEFLLRFGHLMEVP